MSCMFKPAKLFAPITSTKKLSFLPARKENHCDNQLINDPLICHYPNQITYKAARQTTWDEHIDQYMIASQDIKKAESILYVPIDKDLHLNFQYNNLARNLNKKMISS